MKKEYRSGKHQSRKNSFGFLGSSAIRSKDFHNFLDCIPIARGRWHAEEFFDFSEITDRFICLGLRD
jgi:hypothetical protein